MVNVTPLLLPPADVRGLLVPLLRSEEGVRLLVYDDATGRPIVPGSVVVGHPSIGTGRALDTHGISGGESDMLLNNDLAAIFHDLDAHISWWRSLSVPRQAVLAAMAYQLGVSGLLGFAVTLAAIRAGYFARAAAGMRHSKWGQQTPSRVERMATMMELG